MKRPFPIFFLLTAFLLAWALYQALVAAPTERTMGDVQRIFYYHVPSAWTAFLLFFINFIASAQFLASTNPVAQTIGKWTMVGIGVAGAVGPYLPQMQAYLPRDMRPSAIATTALAIPASYFLVGKLVRKDRLDVLAITTAEVGVVFCTVVLVTGPIWAKPVWGIWWTWDLRLTSTLLMWLIYVSYLMLRRLSHSAQTQLMAAVWAVFGALDVPFVYLSIWYFVGQHPRPVIGGGGSIDPHMMLALMVNWLAFLCFAFLVCRSRFRLELLQREAEEAYALESLADEGSSAPTPAAAFPVKRGTQ